MFKLDTVTKSNLVPVSTRRTGCVAFNRDCKNSKGYQISDGNIKESPIYVETYEEALEYLRSFKDPKWRYGNNGSGTPSQRSAKYWVFEGMADLLNNAKSDEDRIRVLYKLIDNGRAIVSNA